MSLLSKIFCCKPQLFITNNGSLSVFCKGDQVGELSKGSRRTTVVAGKRVVCLV
jgi:hypothetical protein